MLEPSANRLDGWKAIGDYLGRDPRTVQRWREERGMPVHRVPGSRGGSVFAYRAELDDWLNSQPEERNPVTVPATPNLHTSAPQPSNRNSATRFRVPVAIAALFLITAATVVMVDRKTRTHSAAVPSEFHLTGTTLAVSDAAGRTLWTVELPHSLARAGAAPVKASLHNAFAVDLNGDQTLEVLAVVEYTDPARGGGRVLSELYCFDIDGRSLWTYRPNVKLRFGSAEFVGPWVPTASSVTWQTRARVWLAFNQGNWWPSFVVGVDANGTQALEFVNAGHIYALKPVRNAGGSFVLVGGVNNEWNAAALAVLDASGPPAKSPQSLDSPYACSGGCPDGSPIRYLLFPKPEVYLDVPFVSVTQIENPDDAGIIELSVRQIGEPRAIYRLSPDLRPQSVGFADAYWIAHERLSVEGKIEHPANKCPERTTGIVVRMWEPEVGWREIHVPPTFAQH